MGCGASARYEMGRSWLRLILTGALLVVLLLAATLTIPAYADDVVAPKGEVFEFSDESHYEILSENTAPIDGSGLVRGGLTISGNFSESEDDSKGLSYVVYGDNLAFSYRTAEGALDIEEGAWSLVDDRSKQVDGQKLDENILSGAIVVQSSLDGISWHIDTVLTDIFSDEVDLTVPFYSTKDIQLENGCYFRILVVYKLQMKVDSTKVLILDFDEYDTKKIAEVYEFYAIGDETLEFGAPSAADGPRRELGNKIKTGNDNGYADELDIDNDDPHYGWDLGTFTVNGYTRETEDENGNPVFLKDVGDRVTLWFTLEQDITQLNGDESMSVSDDTNGYD